MQSASMYAQPLLLNYSDEVWQARVFEHAVKSSMFVCVDEDDEESLRAAAEAEVLAAHYRGRLLFVHADVVTRETPSTC